MIERLEGTFWGYQDVELFYQVWKTKSPRGTLVVTHGLAEHSDCYAQFAESIAPLGWNIFCWDLRGHGRSEGKRGYVNRFQDFSDDLDNAIRFVKAQVHPREKPLILFGHSLGGMITLKTLIQNAPSGIAALALSSPAVGLSLKVPVLKEKFAEILANWAPKFTLYNEVQFDQLIRDDKLVQEYKTDPLRHDKISPRLFLGLVEAFEEVKAKAGEIHIPVIMQLAGKEKIVSRPASEQLFELLGSKKKEIYIYAESFHEIFNDLDRDEVIRDLSNFLDQIEKSHTQQVEKSKTQ